MLDVRRTTTTLGCPSRLPPGAGVIATTEITGGSAPRLRESGIPAGIVSRAVAPSTVTGPPLAEYACRPPLRKDVADCCANVSRICRFDPGTQPGSEQSAQSPFWRACLHADRPIHLYEDCKQLYTIPRRTRIGRDRSRCAPPEVVTRFGKMAPADGDRRSQTEDTWQRIGARRRLQRNDKREKTRRSVSVRNIHVALPCKVTFSRRF